MGLGKWIGGIVGFMAAGPLGALAGYVIGSMLENSNENYIKKLFPLSNKNPKSGNGYFFKTGIKNVLPM